MQKMDNEFFEMYKRLDNLCRDMYSCRNGVSEYISQMEQAAYQGKYKVYSWDDDYKKLKHLRWVRNRIAHDSGVFQICEPHDIDAVHDFYDRILSGQDPLALLRKITEARPLYKKTEYRQQTATQQIRHTINCQPEKDKSSAGAAVIVSIIVVAIIIAFYFLTR